MPERSRIGWASPLACTAGADGSCDGRSGKHRHASDLRYCIFVHAYPNACLTMIGALEGLQAISHRPAVSQTSAGEGCADFRGADCRGAHGGHQGKKGRCLLQIDAWSRRAWSRRGRSCSTLESARSCSMDEEEIMQASWSMKTFPTPMGSCVLASALQRSGSRQMQTGLTWLAGMVSSRMRFNPAPLPSGDINPACNSRRARQPEACMLLVLLPHLKWNEPGQEWAALQCSRLHFQMEV